jgi:tetratricopeptide (TPR) repeat protein/CHAT domain-containing protein
VKASESLRAFQARLLARAFLAALLYLLQPGPVLIADQQDDAAKRSSLNQQVVELSQAGKFNEAVPIAQEFLELCEKAFGPDHPETADALYNLGELYHSLRDYAKAEQLLKRALQIDEKALGSDHPDTATIFNTLGQLYRDAGDYSKAEQLLKCALEINEKALGPDHPDTASALNNLGRLYYSTGEYAKAKPLVERALKIREETPGPEHNDSAKISSLAKQVTELCQAGKFDEAIPILQEFVELAEKALGPDHPGTATALSNLAEVYSLKSDYAKAEPLLKRALEIDEKAFGPDHPNTATALNTLAVLYRSVRDYAKAEPLFQRALKIKEKALGPNHPNTAETLNDLGELYRSMGDYAKAEPLLQRALKIKEKALGPDHRETANTLNDLAMLYSSMGDYAKAEPLLQRALQIKEKARGSDHPETATALNHLGALYSSAGDYARAEPLLWRSLQIEEKALGRDHPQTAPALNSLAQLYYSMGDYAKAELSFQRVLQIEEKALGPDHPDTANALNNLALLYYSMGDYAKAEPLIQRALQIGEKALGPDHRETATALSNLGVLYIQMGDYAKAEPLFQRAVKIKEKALGPDHRETATALNNLAGLYSFMGDYGKAEPLFQRALRIEEKALGPDHPDTGKAINNLGELYGSRGDYVKAEPLFQRALQIEEKALGPDHPDTAKALNNLGLVKINLGETKNAISLAKREREAEEKNLSNILSFASEQQRLAFQKTTNPYSVFAMLGNAAELAQTVLRQKGVVLDSLLEDRLVAEASADPKQREVIAQLRAAKQRLMQLVLGVPKDASEAAQKQRAAEKGRLSTEVEQLEGGLARRVAGLGKARRALSVTVPQVQSVLPKQSALIELLRYSHYVGRGKFENRYGAVVLTPSGEPKWLPLGAAAEIEEDVKVYQKSVRGKTDEATLHAVLKGLAERVWASIEKALPTGTKTVIISPDGELSFVSFATLLTPDDRFLGEKYSISYVASGRDLLRESTPSGSPTTIVFANPDFGSQAIAQAPVSSSSVVLRSMEMRDLQSMRLSPLPGTEKEAADLEKRAGKAAKVFLGPNATEAELRQVSSPRILHLATHGFFLPELELGKQAKPLLQPIELTKQTNPLQLQPGEIPKIKLENPMYRNGLALAGAQRTFKAWSGEGEVPPVENDGVVTGEEVGGLKLNGTWLVVLSACDTGSGEARAGEGVMGLRRGFIQAGAQNLLMTLWPINDQATVKIMLDFYEAADKSHNAPQALAGVQRDALVEIRSQHGREHSLLDAVRLAGSFIMTSQGKP